MSVAPAPGAGTRCGWSTSLQHRQEFTTFIRNTLQGYGAASTCLKELLANADDAKATHFTVCLDSSQYSTVGLLSDGMIRLQGPALLVCNDSEFSSGHWHSYTQKVGDSAKANDGESAGKFGIGALTAYGPSDVVQIVSGSHMLVLDPHTSHLQMPDHTPSVFGNIVSDSNDNFISTAQECPGQLEPFLSFTKHFPSVPTMCDRQHYPGSIIRLALRTAEAAATSKISNESFTSEDFCSILDTFIQGAPDLLLFTRHVKSISIWLKKTVDSPCSLLHSCNATATQLQLARPVSHCTLQTVTVSRQNADGSTGKTIWAKASHTRQKEGEYGGDVAALVQHEGLSQELPAVEGKVYSTLALPLQNTRLPMHINGTFIMSSDRRTLVTGEGDRGQVNLEDCNCVKTARGTLNTSICAGQVCPVLAVADSAIKCQSTMPSACSCCYILKH